MIRIGNSTIHSFLEYFAKIREEAQSDCAVLNREPVQMDDGTQVRDFEVEQHADKFVIFGLKSQSAGGRAVLSTAIFTTGDCDSVTT